MKLAWLLIVTLLLTNNSRANEYEYPIQTLFSDSESGVFNDLQSGKLLKPVIDNGRTVYMEQDGEIFEEDVATLDDAPLGLQSSFSFAKSKRLLGRKVYTEHLQAFYSDCRYRLVDKKFVPVASSCGFKYRKNKNRSERIEWEHIVPAWHFGHQLQCWQNGGRLHCRNSNKKFRQMEADMHNLVPAIGEINGDRSNYKFSMISGEPRVYGKPVNMEILSAERKAEPPESVHGDIARTYFYMMDRYDMRISDQQKQLFIAWNNSDPVDRWESEKNQRVKDLQGDENKYVSNYKRLEQDDIIDSAPSENFEEIVQSLRQRFSFLFDYLPAQIVEVLLLLGGIFLWWRHRRNKRATQEIEAAPSENKSAAVKSADKEPKDSTIADKEATSDEADNKPSYVKIQSAMHRLVLAIDDNDALIVEGSSRAHSQRWLLQASNQTDGFNFIQHLQSGKVLAVADALKKANAPVVLEDQKRRSNDHQEWRLISSELDNSHLFIENRATGYVLDITHKKMDEDARVASHHKKSRGTENQLWRLKHNK